MRFSPRLPMALLAVGAISLGAAACGSNSDSKSSTAAGAGAAAAAPTTKAPAVIASLKGVDTKVTLDPATAGVLTQKQVQVAPVAPATASTAGGGTTVSFPITGGNATIKDRSQSPYITGMITHSGGLTFTAGGKSLSVTDFIVDPGASMLSATVAGKAGVPLLFLDGSNVQVAMEGSNVVLTGTVAKLTSTAAAALNQYFGVSFFAENLPLGTVRLTAAG